MTRVYYCRIEILQHEDTDNKYMSKMNDWRISRINACRSDEQRMEALAAGAALSFGLERDFDVRLVDMSVEIGSLGKPYFSNRPDIYFNLSHSGGIAFCAISDVPVGCDIQAVGKSRSAIAERYFHPDEAARLASLQGAERTELFYKLWALKESYVKMMGGGISSGFSRFCIETEPYPHMPGARFALFKIHGAYAAVCESNIKVNHSVNG